MLYVNPAVICSLQFSLALFLFVFGRMRLALQAISCLLVFKLVICRTEPLCFIESFRWWALLNSRVQMLSHINCFTFAPSNWWCTSFALTLAAAIFPEVSVNSRGAFYFEKILAFVGSVKFFQIFYWLSLSFKIFSSVLWFVTLDKRFVNRK